MTADGLLCALPAGESVGELDTNLQTIWTVVFAADALEMRIAGDTRGLGSTLWPGPEYFS